ncbi:MAG: hypothetical protein JOZ99_09025, partial [Actinobacteria bacterium]|nr:hypothetical protein [Actinomycetota bacterium]
YALWFLALLVAESGLVRPRLTVVVSCALAIALTATLGVRVVAFQTRVMAARDAIVRSSGAAYPLDPPHVVTDRCALRAVEATGAHTTIVVYLTDLKMAYACSALAYQNVEGLSADNDRRTWLFYAELHRERTAAVIADVANPQVFCAFASRRATACRPVDDRAVVIRFAPQTLLAELQVLAVPVRDFGPRCHLHGTSNRTCNTPLKFAGALPGPSR